ncbi:hypothetical protein J6590_096340 [Homalodisca vitripennis]|nr:hypothetical protein J6590_096340 [Homalodisca vitripennis]
MTLSVNKAKPTFFFVHQILMIPELKRMKILEMMNVVILNEWKKLQSESTTSTAHLDYIHNQPQFSDQVEEPKGVPRELQNKAEEPLQDSTQQESFSTTSQVEVSHTPKRQKTCQTHQVQNATTFTKTSNTINKKKKL